MDKKYKDYTLIESSQTQDGEYFKYRIDFTDGTWKIIEFVITDEANLEFTYKGEAHEADSNSPVPVKNVIEWICEVIEEWLTDDDLPY